MAVSFHTPIKALASVGFSLGDIALVAGAGRAVGTWLRARYLDQSLLDLVDVADIIPRTGLFDVAELERRWSKRMVLFHDGGLLPLGERETKLVLEKEKLDRFTWFMALVTAALLAATSSPCMERIILDILTDRCSESVGYEYLVRDLKRNVEAWSSIARTRVLARAAKDRWKALEIDERHLPGLVPDADRHDLTRFLLWLMGAGEGGRHNNIFRTASTDTCSLAVVLAHLGISSLHAGNPSHVADQSQLVVVLDPKRFVEGAIETRSKRRGMRINLRAMEESVSLWPGTVASNNRRRDIFTTAMHSAENIRITPGRLASRDTRARRDFHPVMIFAYHEPKRMPQNIHKFAEEFLLAPDREACQTLCELVQGWGLGESAAARELQGMLDLNPQKVHPGHLSDLQVFVLGYYYSILYPIVDTRHMLVPEAFGSWSWDDLELFQIIKSGRNLNVHFMESDDTVGMAGDPRPLTPINRPEVARNRDAGLAESGRGLHFWKRSYILRLVAYLFAGADMKQICSLDAGCCGVKGKLTVVDAALLGDADTAAKICKFALLDVDDTVFPSNSLGVLRGGGQEQAPFTMIQEGNLFRSDEIVLPPGTEDFTSLVEPKWDVDNTACVVTYRRKGRFVHSVDPETIFQAVLGSSPLLSTMPKHGAIQGILEELSEPPNVDGTPTRFTDTLTAMHLSNHRAQTQRTEAGPDEFTEISLDMFDGGRTVLPPISDGVRMSRAYVATNGLPKIRSCVVSVCFMDTPDSLDVVARRSQAEQSACQSNRLIVNIDQAQIVVE